MLVIPKLSIDLKTGVSRTDFELDPEEYAAIGKMTVQWAYLEHGVYAISKAISDAANVALPKDASSTSFSRRLRALQSLVGEFAPADEQKRITSLIGKIANAEQDRHKITHAMWDWDRSDPERISASSFRPRFQFEKHYNAQQINALADRIGEINFALEYPDGWEAALMETMAEHTDGNGNVAYASLLRPERREYSARRSRAPKGSG